MHSNLMTSIHTLLANPDRPDLAPLFKVFADDQASNVLACLAPPGSLAQIAAALRSGWEWYLDRWEWQTDNLLNLVTAPQCPSPGQMIMTWSRIPSAVGVLRDQTDPLIAWAQQRRHPGWYVELSTLLSPSNAAARLLVQSPFSDAIGRTLRLWSMATDPDAPTAWHAMIDPDMRAALHQRASPSRAFPAWGGDNDVNSDTILHQIVTDLLDGWSPEHPSLQGRIGWLEHHVDPNLDVDFLTLVASIGRSDALAEAVCDRITHDPGCVFSIASHVPWSRLYPCIQTVIDETMHRSPNERWKRTWACALGQVPLGYATTIDAKLLLWRIDPERWNDHDPSIRAALVSSIIPPSHCYGWGGHPDLVGRRDLPYENIFRLWNPNVPPDDLLAWEYADLLRAQSTLQDAQGLITLLNVLPSNRRARFELIIDWRLSGRPEATAQSLWDWTVWAALPAADQQRRLRDRLRLLWGDRTNVPAYRVWMARTHLLDTVTVAVRDLLDSRRAPRILAALLAQVPALRVHMPNHRTTLPFPDDLDAARRAQIERLPLPPDAQAYAAWCLRVIARSADVGADLIALHPDVAVALAPVLTIEQRAMVTASPAAQGWESMTHLHWVAACAPAEEPTTSQRQRRIP